MTLESTWLFEGLTTLSPRDPRAVALGLFSAPDELQYLHNKLSGAGGKGKHAFVGLGFRERPQAYDFQAAVFDHMKYPTLTF